MGASSFHHFSPPCSREKFLNFLAAAILFISPSSRHHLQLFLLSLSGRLSDAIYECFFYHSQIVYPTPSTSVSFITLRSSIRCHLRVFLLSISGRLSDAIYKCFFYHSQVVYPTPSTSVYLLSPYGFGAEPALTPGINPTKLYPTARYQIQVIPYPP